MSTSLRTAIAWTSLARILTQIATWGSTLFVARILSPEDYGVVAAATTYLAFMRMIAELGIGSAIVSSRVITDEQSAHLMGLACGVGAVLWIATASMSGPIANVLGVPEASHVLPILGISTALSVAAAVPSALLQRALRFREIALIDMCRGVLAGSCTLLFAMQGHRYWSLVAGEVFGTVAYFSLLAWRARSRLSLVKYQRIRELVHFGFQVLVGRIAWYTYSNADSIVVARRLGAAALGNYSMALSLAVLPAEKVNSLIIGVTPAFFGNSSDDISRLRGMVLKLIRVIALVIFPATALMALESIHIVSVVLGEKWLQIAPLISALSLFAAVRGILPLFSQLLIARGRANTSMWFALVGACLLPLCFLLGSMQGSLGVALSWSIAYPPLAAAQIYAACKEVDLKIRDLTRSLAPAITGTTGMTAAILCINYYSLQSSHLESLVIDSVLACLAYLLIVSTILPREREVALEWIKTRFTIMK